ncbi:MAG: RIP metalloprotease RseP [Balneolaceae bacterium]
MGSTLLVFAAAIFILVSIHELGHFLAAKWFGMRVDQFSIGFPPKIVGFRRGETEYVLGATPLGGYVKIAGMIDETMDTDFVDQEPAENEFRSKPVWQRMVVILAGVIFNMILAWVIYTGVSYVYGEDVLPMDTIEGIYIPESSLAHEMGLRSGDRIVGVNDEDVTYYNDLFNPAQLTNRNLTFWIERNGERVEITPPSNFLDRLNDEPFLEMGWVLPNRISNVMDDSPAEAAGLQSGDRILAVDGEPTGWWVAITERIQQAEGPLELQVERDGEIMTLSVTPDPEDSLIGIQAHDLRSDLEQIEYGVGGAVVAGAVETSDTFTGILQGLQKLFTGQISVRENLGGPVAIANVTRQATDRGGMRGFWGITAFLSVTLAIMNMLPIPALDGGHFMFLLYEGITRREPSVKVRMALQQIGFVLLIGIFILVTFNDILRTISGS